QRRPVACRNRDHAGKVHFPCPARDLFRRDARDAHRRPPLRGYRTTAQLAQAAWGKPAPWTIEASYPYSRRHSKERMMAKRIQIDFVSDVVCPWCVIGLKGLETALQRLDGEVEADVHFQPFELNPQMPEAGQNMDEHIAE